MRLAIAASGALGLKCLQELPEIAELVCVLTDSHSTGIIAWCNQNKVPVYKGNPRNGKAKPFIQQLSIDILFSVNYLFILEKDLISWPGKFALNIHGSLLPKYRGRTPHVWAIINGEEKTGYTVHLIDEGCDSGDIVYQEEIQITKEMTGADVLNIFNEKYPTAISTVLDMIQSNTLKPVPQDATQASWYGKRTPEDGVIDWSWTNERIYNWVRAQAKPYPGAFSFWNGSKIIIHKVTFSDQHDVPGEYGTIVDIVSDKPAVKTGDGVLLLEEMESSAPVAFYKGGKLHA